MLKKFLCLVLAAATVMSISVTAFAGKVSKRIEIYDQDLSDIYDPSQTAILYLEDSSGDSLT